MLWGSIYRRKYQEEPAHWGMVSVSRSAGPPQWGQVVSTQLRMAAMGDSPVSVGSYDSTSGSSRGSCSSGTGT